MTRERAIKELTELLPEEFLSEYAEAIKMGIEALKQEPCDDAVSRRAVIDTIDKWIKSMHVLIALPAIEVTPLFESVHELPSVTPQPKMGRWIGVNPMVDTLMCSECGENIISEEFKSNYCPNCGAKMQEEKEDK